MRTTVVHWSGFYVFIPKILTFSAVNIQNFFWEVQHNANYVVRKGCRK